MSEKLEKLDAKILKFVDGKKVVSIEDISKYINMDSGARIKLLVSQKYLVRESNGYKELNTGFGKMPFHDYTNNVLITDSGKIAIQDYLTQEKQNSINMWLKNAWIPILVSIVTTLIVNWLPLLLSRIQQLFANFG